MECSKIREKLSDNLDGLVSSEEKRLIDEHLMSCESCRESLSDLRKTVNHVQNLQEIEPPQWLTERIMARVRSESQPKKKILEKLFYPLHIKLPIEAVAAVLVVVISIYIFKAFLPEIKPETHTEVLKAPSENRAPETLSREKDKITSENKPAPAKPLEQPMIAQEPIIGTGKPKEKSKRSVLLAKQKTTPHQVAEQNKAAPSTGAVAKLKQEGTLSYKRPESLFDEKKEKINLTLNVKNVETTSKEIEKVLRELGGRVIKTESFENKNVIVAEIESKKQNELVEKLNSIGQVKKETISEAEGSIKIKIEIVKNLTQ
jgi:putative zinc finger protein/predicted integral membrane protein DUF2275